MMRALAACSACLVLGALGSGCTFDGETRDTGPLVAAEGTAPPRYETIAAAYNARVDGLDRLWARAVVRVEGEDAAGKRLREQAEGHLQVIRPDMLALSMGKVGKSFLHLGSDAEHYWWFDSIDEDNEVGMIGRHEIATPEKAAALGLPVHPLDLIELLGITELPEGSRRVGWSKDRTRAVFTVPARWGSRWVWVDPVTFEPSRIVLADRDLGVVAEAELSRYEIVRIDGDATRQPRVATRVVVTTPGFEGFARITMSEPRNRSIPSVAFDLDKLMRRYRVDQLVDVDDPAFWDAAGREPVPGG
ncbi:MAG: hypothetical protein DHS20C14_05500 [Phycisphaeraceae bacterium]|nr:MAG: hypothetical protein DHS20C14_05500 [Phycisphaeraceae bacterium]